VRLGEPKNPENYEQLEQEEITIYYKASLTEAFNRVTVKVEKLFFLKTLAAIGE